MGPANPIGGRLWENHQNPRVGRISPLCRGPGRRYHLGLLMALEAVRRPSLLACSKALDAVRRPSSIEAHLMHEFMPLEPYLVFLEQTCPIHYFRSKTQVLDGFAPFCCRTRPAAKISIGVHLTHEFVPRKPFLVWSQRTCSIHNFRSKTHVYNSAGYLTALLHRFWWQLM